MKLCLKILSVTWYMFNGLEHTAILNHFLTFITGSSSRLLRHGSLFLFNLTETHYDEIVQQKIQIQRTRYRYRYRYH
jgi:hypothetical protein